MGAIHCTHIVSHDGKWWHHGFVAILLILRPVLHEIGFELRGCARQDAACECKRRREAEYVIIVQSGRCSDRAMQTPVVTMW